MRQNGVPEEICPAPNPFRKARPHLPSASLSDSVASTTQHAWIMKTLVLILSVTLGLALLVIAAETSAGAKAILRHVVAFKFKQSATREEIKQVEDAFRDLKKED